MPSGSGPCAYTRSKPGARVDHDEQHAARARKAVAAQRVGDRFAERHLVEDGARARGCRRTRRRRGAGTGSWCCRGRTAAARRARADRRLLRRVAPLIAVRRLVAASARVVAHDQRREVDRRGRRCEYRARHAARFRVDAHAVELLTRERERLGAHQVGGRDDHARRPGHDVVHRGAVEQVLVEVLDFEIAAADLASWRAGTSSPARAPCATDLFRCRDRGSAVRSSRKSSLPLSA